MDYEELIDYCTTMSRDSSTSAKKVIGQGINRGLRILRKKLKRNFAIETRTFSYVNGQAIYQTPEDCIRPAAIYFIDGSIRDPLTYIDDDAEWDRRKQQLTESGRPVFWRMISNDIYEVWPTPTSSTATGEIRMQTMAKPLTQMTSYATGSVQVTNGSVNVVGTGTSWNATMIGRSLRLADGNGDISYYTINAVTDTTHLVLENAFAGASGSTLAYRIGEVPNITASYHHALNDMGLRTYYQWAKNPELAKDYYADFLAVSEDITEDDQTTTSNVIESKRARDDIMPSYKRSPRAISG